MQYLHTGYSREIIHRFATYNQALFFKFKFIVAGTETITFGRRILLLLTSRLRLLPYTIKEITYSD